MKKKKRCYRIACFLVLNYQVIERSELCLVSYHVSPESMATLEMDIPSSSKPVLASVSPRVGIDPSFCGTTSYCWLAFRTYVVSTAGVYEHENCIVVWGCSGAESKWGARMWVLTQALLGGCLLFVWEEGSPALLCVSASFFVRWMSLNFH